MSPSTRRQPGLRARSAEAGAPIREHPAAGRTRTRRAPPLLFAAIVLLAVLLRGLFLLDFRSSPLFDTPAGPDVEEYYARAREILSGQWWWDHLPLHAPLYSVLLAGSLALAKGSLLLVRGGQLLVGVGAMVVVCLVFARRLGWRPVLAAGVLWAVHIPLIYYESELFSEGWLLFIHACTLALLVPSTMPPPRPIELWRSAVVGLLLGAAVITHSAALVFALLTLAWLAWRSAGAVWSGAPRVTLLGPLIALLCTVLPIAPVTWRNAVVSGEFVLLQRHDGLIFFVGNNPKADGRGSVRVGPDWDRLIARPRVERGAVREADRRSFYYGEALAFIRQSPGQWLWLLARKAALVASAQEVTTSAPLATVRPDIWLLRLPVAPFGWLLPLALVGLTIGGGYRLLPVLLPVAAYVLSGIVFVSAGRYRVPMLPALFLLGGMGVAAILDWIGQRRAHPPPVAGSWRATIVARLGLPLLLLAGVVVARLPVVPADDDDPAEAAWTRAQAYRSRGDLPKAAAELRAALQIRPSYAVAHLVLGEVLDQAGDLPGALACYRQAVAADGQWPKALNRLAVTLRRSGDTAGAMDCLRRALTLDPDHYEAKFNYALGLHRAGRVREAVALYRALLTQRPDADTSRNLAIGLLSLGEPAEAAKVLRNALAAAPDDVALLMRLARLCSASTEASVRNPAEGLSLAQRASDLSKSTDAEVEETLAIAQAAVGRYEQAVETARRALALAERGGQGALREAIQRRIEQFERREDYRE